MSKHGLPFRPDLAQTRYHLRTGDQLGRILVADYIRDCFTDWHAISPCVPKSKQNKWAGLPRTHAISRQGQIKLELRGMLTQIDGFDAAASRHPRRKTYGVKIGHVRVGGGAPIVVQSMTNTDTADIETTLQQTLELAEAGSEIVRWTVNVPEAAAAVPEIKKRMRDAGCDAPIIGDFHYNGHVLLTKFPECAKSLDKYRINPGNVGAGQRRDEQFSTICKI